MIAVWIAVSAVDNTHQVYMVYRHTSLVVSSELGQRLQQWSRKYYVHNDKEEDDRNKRTSEQCSDVLLLQAARTYASSQ